MEQRVVPAYRNYTPGGGGKCNGVLHIRQEESGRAHRHRGQREPDIKAPVYDFYPGDGKPPYFVDYRPGYAYHQYVDFLTEGEGRRLAEKYDHPHAGHRDIGHRQKLVDNACRQSARGDELYCKGIGKTRA